MDSVRKDGMVVRRMRRRHEVVGAGAGILLIVALWVAIGAKGVTRAQATLKVDGAARWTSAVVDRSVSVAMGRRALAVGSDGLPRVVHGGAHLYYSQYDGASWVRTLVDPAPGTGAAPSLALDGADRPHIVYFGYDGTDVALNYAWHDGGGWRIEVVEKGVGSFSFALDDQGRPHIALSRAAAGELQHARRLGGVWTIETVTAGAYDPSLALDGMGRPHIAYLVAGVLEYAWHDGVACQREPLEESVGFAVVALDVANQPRIAHRAPGALRYLWRESSGWQGETVYDGVFDAYWVALALDPLDAPIIGYCRFDSYFDYCRELVLARRDGGGWIQEAVAPGGMDAVLALDRLGQVHLAGRRGNSDQWLYTYLHDGSAWQGSLVAESQRVGRYNSLALDNGDRPHISYQAGQSLNYAYLGPDGWQTKVIDLGEPNYTSLGLDSHGRAQIGYQRGASLFYAAESGMGWVTETLGHGGHFAQLALDSHDRPHLSHSTLSAYDPGLKYVWHDGVAWQTETVDLDGLRGSLALDNQDRPHLSFSGGYPDYCLNYAWRDAGIWQSEPIACPGTAYRCSSLALDRSGIAHVGYVDSDAGAVGYAWKSWIGWQLEVVYSGFVSGCPSLALDGADRPYLSWDGMQFAWRGPDGWHVETPLGWGSHPSLAIDMGGQPHLSYYDGYDLQHASGMALFDLSASHKHAAPDEVDAGERVTYTLALDNSGPLSGTYVLTDPWPAEATYVPGSAWASAGVISDSLGIQWTGAIDGAGTVTATYAVTVSAGISTPTAIVNRATLSGGLAAPRTLRAVVFVSPLKTYLPVVMAGSGAR